MTNNIIKTSGGRLQSVSGIFQVTEFLEKGRFSEVYKAYNQVHGTDVALKIYVCTDEKTKDIVQHEIAILQELKGSGTDYFAIPKGGIRTYNRHPYFAMELGEYTGDDSNKKIISLKTIIPSDELNNDIMEIPEFWKRDSFFNFILGICTAVRTLHKHEIVHRDLKPSNILLKKLPGDEYIKPFFLDFNTSVWKGKNLCPGGTEKYLPPEINAGTRKEITDADDLWAIAKIIWELIFGVDTSVEKGRTPHKLFDFILPENLIDVLLKALSPRQKERYSNATEFHKAIELILSPSYSESTHSVSDEIIWANENTNKIKYDITEVLIGEREIPILKETKDNVAFMFSLLLQKDTQTFDLKNDIMQLGTKAIPAIVEESYKISHESSDFEDVTSALGDLAIKEHDLSVRTIETFCVSSDYNVRSMCLSLCEKLSYFPTNLIENILEDDTLYLPKERVYIADLCIRYSNDSHVMMALNMYMCREYILDIRKYVEIRNNIALKVKELNFKEKARLIVEDTKMRIWEDLPEYKKLTKEFQEKVDKGLLQLFGDAFATLGSEAFEYVTSGSGLPSTCQENALRIASAFIGKLSQKDKSTREWLFSELGKAPSNKRDLFYAAQRLSNNLSNEEEKVFKKVGKDLSIPYDNESIDLSQVFERYLVTGDKNYRNILRWDGECLALDMIVDKTKVETDIIKTRRILSLLAFYENRHRLRILNILFENWNNFMNADFKLLVDVLCNHDISENDMNKKAIELLKIELGDTDRSTAAKEGLEKLLET